MSDQSKFERIEIPVTYDSLPPYSAVSAYRELKAAGLSNIRLPKLVDDPIGDSPSEWRVIEPPSSEQSPNI